MWPEECSDGGLYLCLIQQRPALANNMRKPHQWHGWRNIRSPTKKRGPKSTQAKKEKKKYPFGTIINIIICIAEKYKYIKGI